MPSVVVVNQPTVQLASGSAQFGVADAPLRIDPTGATIQPITGSVNADIRVLGTLVTDANRVPATSVNYTFQQAILRGFLTGSVDRRWGYVGTSSTAITVCKGSTYIEPSSTGQRSIRSSDADDASGDTGARTVKITYYKDDGSGPFTETVTLNGTTWVNTVETDMRFIEKMEVVTVGSYGTNEGTITLNTATGGGGSTIGTIPVDEGSTQWAHHYVGLNKKCFITAENGAITGNNGRWWLRYARPLATDNIWAIAGQYYRLGNNASTFTNDLGVPIVLEGFGRVEIVVRADSGTAATWYMNFSFIEVNV